MTDLHSKLDTIYSLEQLAAQDSCIHRLHPLAKLIVTGCYLLCVASMRRYALFPLAPYLFYPAILLALADVPYRLVLRRACVALPFCLFAGITNLIWDRSPCLVLGGLVLSGGVVSLLAILLRTLLCVAAVLILVAVTPFSALTAQLRRLHVPWQLVTVLEMIYRYLGILLDQAFSLRTAYLLRRGQGGVSLSGAGVLIGQLFLRSYRRASRIYAAMQCRGYGSAAPPQAAARAFSAGDWLFIAVCCLPMLAVRAGLLRPLGL